MKIRKAIVGLLKRLRKEFPNTYFTIEERYNVFTHSNKIEKTFYFYIEDKIGVTVPTFKHLRLEVVTAIKKNLLSKKVADQNQEAVESVSEMENTDVGR